MDIFILLAIVGLLGFVLGPIGFFLTFGLRTRLNQAERKILALQQAMRDLRAPVSQPTSAPDTPESLPESPSSSVQSAGQPEEPAISEVAPEDASISQQATEDAPVSSTFPSETPAPTSTPIPAGQKPSLEEAIGTRWAVWVGGLALGLGAILLVRYSIEQGWFGPEARILMGLGLSAALIASGEYLRRRDRSPRALDAAPDRKPSQIPAVLTAAGTAGAFGAIYAAHALYGFIGPAFTFVALGAVGFATMLAAALHGPALAGFGLLGALITPLLIRSDAPNPWPVVLYLTIVVAFAYALARLRLWLWLALSAAAGGFLWGIALLNGDGAIFYDAALLHAVLQTLLAAALFAVINGAGIADEDARFEPFALLVPAAFAVLVLATLNAGPPMGVFGIGWMAAAGASIVILAIAGLLSAPAASLALAAGAMLALILLIWPPNGNLPLFPSPEWLASWPHPKEDTVFAAFAGIATASLMLTSLKRLFGGQSLQLPAATIYAGSATLPALAVLAIAYLRLAHSEINVPFAAIAGGLALAFLGAAIVFLNRDRAQTHPNLRLGLGACASAALAALALGLVFVLDRGMLTVALALAAWGAAFVDRRLGIGALRWCVAGLGLLIAGRLLYEPRIVGDDLGLTPIFNWLLWGYGVPAVAFGMAAQLLRRRGQDRPVLIAQALSILFSALLFFFEIRHAINQGDPFAETSGLIEEGLFATTAFGFSIVLTRLDVLQTSPVLRFASLGFGIVSFATSLFGLLLWNNPLWSGELVEGGVFINALLIAYALPALLAFRLSSTARAVRPAWYWQGARIAGLLLVFAFANLQLRRLFHDDDLNWVAQPASDAELYTYSALWLFLSILCLALGLWRGSLITRVASAILMLMTILKVFFFDLSDLGGVLRALSFIGLGIVLIGIGFVYQKLVFGRRTPT